MEKRLADIYKKYKKLKGYDDGGEVETVDPDKAKSVEDSFKGALGFADGGKIGDESNDSDNPVLHIIHSMASGLLPKPAPTPTPEEQREAEYARIRHQNLVNMGEADGTPNYASGGKVEIPKEDLIKEHQNLVKDLKGAKDQYHEQKSELHDLYKKYRHSQGYSDGGNVNYSKGYDKGGDVSKKPLINNALLNPDNSLNQYVPEKGLVGGTVYDGSSDEKFLFGHFCFDIDKAREMSKKVPNAEIPVSQKWIDKIRIDKAAATKSTSTNPVFIALVQTPHGVKPLLIDGNHRMQKAVIENRKSIPAHVFSVEETKQLLTKRPEGLEPGQVPNKPELNGSVYEKSSQKPEVKGYARGGKIKAYADGGDVSSTDESPADGLSDEVSVREAAGQAPMIDPNIQTQETVDRKDEPIDRQDEESEAEKVSSAGKSPDDDLDEVLAKQNDEDQQDQEKEDEKDSEDREPSSEEDSRQLPGMTLNASEALANNSDLNAVPDQSSLQKLMGMMGQNQGMSLAQAQNLRDQAISGAQMQRGAAIMGAGMARANPNLVLGAIEDKEKNVNMPVQKYEEQIANQKDDPNSTMSQVMREYMKNKGFSVPEGASASNMLAVAPFLAKDQVLKFQMEKALFQQQQENERSDKSNAAKIEAAKAGGAARADSYKELIQGRKDMQSKQLAGKFVHDVNNDPLIKPSRQNMGSLEKSINLLKNTNLPLTPQVLSDAEQDIANGMQIRGMGGSEGKVNRTQLETVGRMIAQARQKWGNNPSIDLRKTDPALVNQIYKTAQALRDDYQSTIGQAKKQLADEYSQAYGDDPIIMKAVNQYKTSAVGHYEPGQMINYKGQMMQVGPDGDSLIPVKQGK